MVPRIYSQNKAARLSAILLFLFVSFTSFGQDPVFTTPAVCPGTSTVTLPVGGGSIVFTTLNIPGFLTVSASDPGGGDVTYSTDVASVDCSDEGSVVTIIVTATNVDAPNETATCSIDATISNGGGLPAASCMNITVNLSGGGVVTPASIDNGSSSCSGITSLMVNDGGGASASKTYTCADVGMQSLDLEVTDINGTATCTAMITVVDDVDPTFTCPLGLTVPLNASCEIVIPDLITGITDEADNCALAAVDPIVQSPAAGMTVASMDGGTTNVTITVTDVNGNTASCLVTVTGDDVTNPTAICQNITVDLDASGSYTLTAAEVDDGSNDNCGTATLSIPATTYTCADIGTQMVTLTVDDGNGNMDMCTATVTVQDNTSPPILPDLTANNNLGNCEATVTFPINASDNCGIYPIVIVSATNEKGDAVIILTSGTNYFADFPKGINTIEYKITDGAGNVTTDDFTVTVFDNEAPFITCPGTQTLDYANCNTDAMVPNYTSLLNVSDNCPVQELQYDQDPPAGTLISDLVGITPADGETFTVTMTVTDLGASVTNMGSTCSFIVELNENNTPVPTTSGAILTAINEDCGPFTLQAPTAVDECGNIICGEPFPPVAIEVLPCSIIPGGCTPIPARTSADTPLNLPDNTPSGISSTISIPTNALGVAPTVGADLTVQIEITHTWVGDLKVSLTSPDGTTVDLFDRPGVPAGTFGCAADDLSTLFSDASPNSAALFEGSCPPNLASYQALMPLSAFNGESSYGDWVLTVSDNAGGDTGSLDSWTLGFCTDAASTQIAEYEFPVGSHNITWVFDDGAGNSTSQLQQINVTNDIQGPTFNCQDIIVELDGNGNASIVAEDVLASASITIVGGNTGSNLAGQSDFEFTVASATTFNFDWEYSSIDFPGFDGLFFGVNGVFTLLSATDGESGSQTVNLNPGDVFSFTVATADNTFGPGVGTITNFDPGFAGDLSLINWTFTNTDADGSFSSSAGEADDNCSDPADLVFSLSQSTFDCDDIGSNSVTLTVTDEAGNPSTCIATVMVEDNVNPVFDAMDLLTVADTIVDCDSGFLGEAVVDPSADDNCGTVGINFNEASTQAGNSSLCGEYNYSITRTWVATDGSGNSETYVQTISVQDTTAPVIDGILFPDFVSVNADQSSVPCNASYNLELTAGDVVDNCAAFADLTITHTSALGNGGASAFYTYPNGPTVVTFTATDPCGNSVVYPVTVNVTDNTAPIASCKSIVLVGIPNGEDSIIINPLLIDNGSFDNCTGITYSVSPNVFYCNQADGITQYDITLTVTEDYTFGAKSNTCTTKIIIQDNNDPEAVCQNTTVYLNDMGIATITPDSLDGGSFDACLGLDDITLLGPAGFTDVITYTSDQIGDTTATLYVTDLNGNFDICNSTVTVAPPITCFEIADDISVSTGANPVQITATNFTNAIGFQFSIVIDTTVANFTGVDIVGPNAGSPYPLAGIGTFTETVLPANGTPYDTINISWFSSTPLNEGTTPLFDLLIDVVGAVGDVSPVNFITSAGAPLPVDAIVQYGFNFFSSSNGFPPCTEDGSIEVNEFATVPISGNVRTWGISFQDTIIDLTDPMMPDTTINTVVVVPEQPVQNVIITKEETYAGFVGFPDPLTNTQINANAATTDINGDYTADIQNFPGGVGLDVHARKDFNWVNDGDVSGSDLFFIQQHIVGNIPFTSIYEYIAADANRDQEVSTLDLVLIQSVIVSPDVPSNPTPSIVTTLYRPWEFVPARDSFHLMPLPSNPAAPFNNGTISFPNYTSSDLNVDWIAVKIGQVFGNLDPTLLIDQSGTTLTSTSANQRDGNDLVFSIENQAIENGELISIPVYAKDYSAFVSWQFTMEFDANSMAFERMIPGAMPNFGEGRLGVDAADQGIIGAVWYGLPTTISDDEVLFTLEFRALKDAAGLSGLINLTSLTVKAETYLTNGETGNVELDFFLPETTTNDSEFTLYQNRPNPFNDKTMISFVLPEAGFAKMTIFDISGKVLKLVEGDFVKGYNEVNIQSTDFPTSGVLYYQLESADNTATMKMIILD